MSENKHTQKEQLAKCESMSRLQSIISGKWKILIIWYISVYKIQRFGELQRRLGDITQSTLTKQLRELENDGILILLFVSRTNTATFPLLNSSVKTSKKSGECVLIKH